MWCSTMEGEDRRRDLAGASHAEVRAIAMMPGRRAGKRRKIGRAAMPSGIYACFRHGQRAAPIILEEGADDREPRRRWTDDTPCQRVVRNLAARRLRVCLRWRPTLVLCIIYVASRRFLHPVNRWNSTIGANPSPAPWGIMFPERRRQQLDHSASVSIYVLLLFPIIPILRVGPQRSSFHIDAWPREAHSVAPSGSPSPGSLQPGA